MNPAEARSVLREHLASFHALSFADLAALVPASPLVGDRIGTSGARYETEVRVEWVGAPGTALRVAGTIDGGGRRALMPLHEEFMVRGGEAAPPVGSD